MKRKNATKPLNYIDRRILLSVPHMGGSEIRYVQEAFDTNWLSTVGPNLTALENEFSMLTGLPSVALGSGTAGIHLGLKLLGLKPGDEVVSPSLTFVASCNPILYEQGTPVFIDSEYASWNMNPQLLADFLKKRATINKLPRIVMAVHMFGQSADMDPILDICRQYELPLLEDAAECLGAKYKGKTPGSIGDVGIYSFNGNKIVTCTGGGMLVSARNEWVDKARYWSTQACDPGLDYLHSEIGYNYRLSNVLAGIARGQLEVLELRVQQRRAVFARYRQAFEDLPGIEPQPEADFGEHAEKLKLGKQPSEVAGSPVKCAAKDFTGQGLHGPRKAGIERAEHGKDEHPTFNIQHSTLNSGQQPSSVLCPLSSDLSPPSSVLRPLSSVPSPQSPDLSHLSSVLRPLSSGSLHTRWLSCFLIDEAKFGMSRAELVSFLDAANVEARPVWKPMHTQKLYQGYECIGGQVAEDLNRRGICLPSSSSLTEEDQQFVIERIREAAKAKA